MELCAQELAVWRGERCLFEGLDLTLGPGKLGLVVGANGSGKSTLLRVLAGLATATSGAVTWRGSKIEALPFEYRGDIAYRGHLDGLKRDLTVLENLRFHATIWRGRPELDTLLEEVALGAVGNVRVRHLSAGQQRRASLATLKLGASKVWILDEPTTNLDTSGRGKVIAWIRAHLEGGGTAVVATHQPDELAQKGALVVEL
ncbi:MAG TPA: heme ABC exporter ATP-binding protein CcmA [Gammaproteobacteria bacterium]|nr:heme ABC exporter ATP-binding protein CcmA [Gammaproteobacteria bacterium]